MVLIVVLILTESGQFLDTVTSSRSELKPGQYRAVVAVCSQIIETPAHSALYAWMFHFAFRPYQSIMYYIATDGLSVGLSICRLLT